MNAIIKSVLIGIAAVIVGFIFAGLFGSVFKIFSLETATLFGMGLYLCFVVVVCAGIIISTIDKK